MNSTNWLKDMFDNRAQGLCPFCAQEIDPASFRDNLSIREFRISGLCQACQDKTFGDAS